MSKTPVENVSLPLFKICLISMAVTVILWVWPFMCGKYTDVTYPAIPTEAISLELVGMMGLRRQDEMDWCPSMSPLMENQLRLLGYDDADSVSEEEIARKYVVTSGGEWMPDNCQSRYQVAIIIPYRNRSDQLQQFLSYMHPFLQRQQLEYKIVIVEQIGIGPFNRGKLLNIGFVETQKVDTKNCFIFHDVDLLPQHDYNVYACTHYPRHMYSAVDTFRYNLPYRSLFGGAIAMLGSHFIAVDGFSNRFSGWGGEDDDLYRRLERQQLRVNRFSAEVASYVMLQHTKAPPAQNRWNNLQTSEVIDGLTSLKYKLVEMEKRPLYTWLFVEL